MAVVRQEAPGIPLEKLSERDLIDRVQRDDDERALEELVRRFLPLARGLAHRYVHTSEPGDDLVQVACVGFMAAVKRYDASYGKPLRSFAIPTMLGELRRHFRDTGWAVHVPRRMQELGRDAQRAIEQLTAERGQSPTLAEIAARLGVATEDLVEALEARTAYRPDSLDAPSATGESATPLARMGREDPGFARAEASVTLERAMRALPERERAIVILRFGEELSQSEIGNTLGMSQMHVSRLLRRALTRIEAVVSA